MNKTPSGQMSPRRLGTTASLWLMGSILLAFLAASSAPSPLYGLYREAWGFSALVLTVVFASYALALLAALLVFGTLSDHRGRRELVLASLALELVAVAWFRHADTVGWLLAARILQGVATGMLTSAIGAGLIDLDRHRGALINSVAPMVGLGVGALGAGILVQLTEAPEQWVFDALLVVFALLASAAFYLPETTQRKAGAWRSLRPVIVIPPNARRTLLRVLPVNTAQWALGGFFLSLGPSLTTAVTGDSSPLTGGAVIAALVFSSAITMILVRTSEPRTVLAGGSVALISGALLILAGIAFHSIGLFVTGALIGGAGFGGAFSGSIRSLVPLAAPHERAALMTVFFSSSYLAFSLPAIGAGLFAGRYGLEATSKGYLIGVAALAAIALLEMVMPQPGGKSRDAAVAPTPALEKEKL